MEIEAPQYQDVGEKSALTIQGGHEEHYGVFWQYAFGAHSRALSLATLCFGYFGTLPQARLEVLFRLVSKHSSSKGSIYGDLRKEAYDALIIPAYTVDDLRAATTARKWATDRLNVTPTREDTHEASINWEKVRSAVKGFQLQKYDTVWVGSGRLCCINLMFAAYERKRPRCFRNVAFI
jgi:hypothetical protein